MRGLKGRLAVGGLGVLLLALSAGLIAYGLSLPDPSTAGTPAFATIHGTNQFLQPPFHSFLNLDIVDVNHHRLGTHFYLLGSDPGGRDLIALTARGALPSLALVSIVLAARFLVGLAAGFAMGLGPDYLRSAVLGLSSWVIGFPYLALALIFIEALTRNGRLLAFVVGMAMVGWRDIATLVADRIDNVRSQPYALAAKSLGSEGLRFFRSHVVPHLQPALALEIPFQISGILVLLAELGYLKVYLGPIRVMAAEGDNNINLLTQPELGQLLADSRRYLLYHQWEPVLVPAIVILTLVLGFELLGMAIRGRSRFSR